MSNPASIIVGLEVGTSKVCAVVGELGADGALNVVGLGQARSRGVRKGEIADTSAAEEDIRQAIVEAKHQPQRGGHLRRIDSPARLQNP